MSRSPLSRRPCHRLMRFGAGLTALGLAAASVGCTDDTPRPRSADLGASRKAAAEGGRGGYLDLGPKTGDVGPTRSPRKYQTGPSASRSYAFPGTKR